MKTFNLVEPCLAALKLDSVSAVQLQDAVRLVDSYHPPFGPGQHVLLFRLCSSELAGAVKHNLENQYPGEHPIAVVRNAGLSNEQVDSISLDRLDRLRRFSSISCLHISPLPQKASFEELQRTVAHLRAPVGCPWDREQTHQSLRTHILEETYETLAAIDAEDSSALAEELGDLLLQIVMQVQIAVEDGEFYMADVIAGINSKLIRRHPHVFGDLKLSGVEQVLQNWDELKAAEREQGEGEHGSLDGVPATLPALAQANELQVRAGRAGFDWPDQEGVFAKLMEEIQELQESQISALEFGDLLFTLVNISRWLRIDAEAELRKANLKFRTRFDHLHALIESDNKVMTDLSLSELDEYWEIAKRETRS
jgi:tetrapyrrole methylase family protein/MazG family protein